MGDVFSFLTGERLSQGRDQSVTAQFSTADIDQLQHFVEWCREKGVRTTTEAVVYALVRDGLEAWAEFLAESEVPR